MKNIVYSLSFVAASLATSAFAQETQPEATPTPAAQAEAPAPAEQPAQPASSGPRFEFHGYLGAEIGLNPSLTKSQISQLGDWWGTNNREATEPGGWFRISPQMIMDNSKIVVELESDIANFKNLSGDKSFNFTTGSFYYEANLDDSVSLWFGQRRYEFNQQRFSGQKLLNPTGERVRGFGFTANLGGGNSNETIIHFAKSEAELNNTKYSLPVIELFDRFEYKLTRNVTLVPLIKINYTGSNDSLEEAEKTSNQKYEAKNETQFGVGSELHISGAGHWTSLVVALETEKAKGYKKNGDQDTVVKLGAQGGVDVYADQGFGMYWGALAFIENFKYEQVKSKATDGGMDDTTEKTKSATTVALNVQPIYYATPSVYMALDLGYAMRAKVAASRGLGQPDSFSVTPILRYAPMHTEQGSAIALPQFYVSYSYTKFMDKTRKAWGIRDAKGKPADSWSNITLGAEVSW